MKTTGNLKTLNKISVEIAKNLDYLSYREKVTVLFHFLFHAINSKLLETNRKRKYRFIIRTLILPYSAKNLDISLLHLEDILNIWSLKKKTKNFFKKYFVKKAEKVKYFFKE